ncbi:MAG: aminotransferase class I/II-fold pyridoxal phosphate-dependent enzyme [Clostridiales Family XIII bacterium]|jgi:threonine aldolase|nr:aminotransferase class I/II-fold pyridoxal phosphate-dependent enzyme [Clostridiales Family XIII bacterium]
MNHKINLMNDYNLTAHPEVIGALAAAGNRRYTGYGDDEETLRACDLIRVEAGLPGADVYLLSGGTQTNMIAARAFLRPHEAIIATETSHIYNHETGAIEAAGHKILPFAGSDGKLLPGEIEQAIANHVDEHMVRPKMVYLSQATEYGTVYSREELVEIKEACVKHGLYLYVDGARLGYAMAAEGGEGCGIKEVAAEADAFYIGGTKQGLLFGEALVISNENLKKDFRFILKQGGGMLAKGFVLGIQFRVLFQNGLYYKLSKQANEKAKKLRDGIRELGYEFEIESVANQVFPIVDNQVMAELEKDFLFEKWHRKDEGRMSIRFTTTWATPDENIEALLSALKKLR